MGFGGICQKLIDLGVMVVGVKLKHLIFMRFGSRIEFSGRLKRKEISLVVLSSLKLPAQKSVASTFSRLVLTLKVFLAAEKRGLLGRKVLSLRLALVLNSELLGVLIGKVEPVVRLSSGKAVLFGEEIQRQFVLIYLYKINLPARFAKTMPFGSDERGF